MIEHASSQYKQTPDHYSIQAQMKGLPALSQTHNGTQAQRATFAKPLPHVTTAETGSNNERQETARQPGLCKCV